jgi:hypothetical protein
MLEELKRNRFLFSVAWPNKQVSGTATSTVCSIVYKKTFDSVHKDTLWKIMESYGISSKLVRIIKAMYSQTEYAVRTGNVCSVF